MKISILRFLYTVAIYAYGLSLKLAAFFHAKARLWVAGRENWEKQLREHIAPGEKWVWFHCASLGEFEQARNLIDAIKKCAPDHGILVSFYSPSGYEIRKHYSNADYVCYLPLDTPRNMKKWADIVRPQVAFLVKYELWLHMMGALHRMHIPVLLISARLTEESGFLRKPFAPLFRKAFLQCRAIFTQDDDSARLLESFTEHPMIIHSSDTRYDRVSTNVSEFVAIPEVEAFRRDRLCIVCGSTWPVAEAGLMKAYEKLRNDFDLCLILAPHEIDLSRIQKWIDAYPEESLRYADISNLNENHNVLWVDHIGKLSRLYNYADVAYVGGAWSKGLHNILEAAVFGCPIIFGSNIAKFPEAQDLVKEGGAFTVDSPEDLEGIFRTLLNDGQRRKEIRGKNSELVQHRQGATRQILQWCVNEKHLPTDCS